MMRPGPPAAAHPHAAGSQHAAAHPHAAGSQHAAAHPHAVGSHALALGPEAGERTVVVTGAAGAIGHALIKGFARAGWRVAACSPETPPDHCGRDRGRSLHVYADLLDEAALAEFVAQTEAFLDGGPLHALVNNAALRPLTPMGVLQGGVAAWRRAFEANVIAPVRLTRAFAPALARTTAALGPGRAAVVNITAQASRLVHPLDDAAWASAKAALSALTREMASELGALGVRVNAVAPGVLEDEEGGGAQEELLLPRSPLGRLGRADEAAAAALFLCSDAASYVTGEELFVDGGWRLRS